MALLIKLPPPPLAPKLNLYLSELERENLATKVMEHLQFALKNLRSFMDETLGEDERGPSLCHHYISKTLITISDPACEPLWPILYPPPSLKPMCYNRSMPSAWSWKSSPLPIPPLPLPPINHLPLMPPCSWQHWITGSMTSRRRLLSGPTLTSQSADDDKGLWDTGWGDGGLAI